MEPKGRRVAVTGLGVVAPCGIGATTTGAASSGRGSPPAGRPRSPTGIRRRGTSSRRRPGGPTASSSSPSPRPPRRSPRPATRRAGWASTRPGSARSSPPASAGCTPSRSRSRCASSKGERRVSPFLVPMMMANAAGAAISMRWGLQGPNETIATACAAGTHAIGNAARLIAWGRCDAVVTGGTESSATLTALAGFGNMTALSSTGISRPFDVDRDGFVMGEGSAVLILEEWEHAVGRGAPHPRRDRRRRPATPTPTTSPRRHLAASGAAACMRLALDDAGHGAGRHRPDQRPRHVDAAQRRRRGRGGADRVRRRRPAGHVDQGRDRSCARCRRRPRGGRRAAVVRAPPDPADGQHEGRRPRHRRRHRRRPRVGARPDDVEQLRLRRPQRLRSIISPSS